MGKALGEITIGELGPLLGLALLFWRVSLGIWITRLSLSAALRHNILPMIFVGATFVPLLSGQVTQPTNLGFVAVVAGLNLAALNQPQITSQSQ